MDPTALARIASLQYAHAYSDRCLSALCGRRLIAMSLVACINCVTEGGKVL